MNSPLIYKFQDKAYTIGKRELFKEKDSVLSSQVLGFENSVLRTQHYVESDKASPSDPFDQYTTSSELSSSSSSSSEVKSKRETPWTEEEHR
ncbi:hypothetical protein L1049_012276 [Liquidambar formosana]|uniref:Uncharacterized protein n=1 Tax=Liquidambar formosana TaxID=63359 RepID=A0AAP0WYP0_LIQFO